MEGAFRPFHYTQLTPSPESRMKRTPAAKSMTRCSPIQLGFLNSRPCEIHPAASNLDERGPGLGFE